MKSGGSKFVIFVSVLLAVTLASAQDPPYLYDLSMFNGDSQALTADNLSPAVTVAINDYNDYNDLRNRRRLQSFTKMSNELKDLAILPLPINPEKLSQILQKIAKACDYSDDESRAVLQNDPFVRKVVNACISEGDRAESEGEFLKAYTDYYKCLAKIYDNNKSYSDKAAALITKAEIKSSLTDSPCEKYTDRYLGIRREMFTKALDVVDQNYVVRITDYRQMAIAGLNRCKLLAKVTGQSQRSMNTEYFVSSLEGLLAQVESSSNEISKEQLVDVFRQVLAANASRRVIDEKVMIAHFTKGALSALDRFTSVIWPSQIAELEKSVTGNFTGVGITFGKINGTWVIKAILPETPAGRSSLQAGDAIVAVEGMSTDSMTSQCMVKYITGASGSSVTITVQKEGTEDRQQVRLKRSAITVPAVQGFTRNSWGKWQYMIDPAEKIGYIKINSFTKSAADEFKAILASLNRRTLKGLVVDLRDNPGGLVTSAAEIVDCFIDRGMIVSLRPRFGMGKYMTAQRNYSTGDYPIAVVVNSSTASAAEIVAGALQDKKHSRAFVVGSRTYGKGSVQNIIKIKDQNAKLKFTMARYHLPSGKKVEPARPGSDEWGITPDIEVKLTPEERTSLTALRNDQSTPAFKDILSEDPQLYTAVTAVKTTASDSRFARKN